MVVQLLILPVGFGRFSPLADGQEEDDRARKNLDRHPNYILAAYMASGPGLTTRHCPCQ